MTQERSALAVRHNNGLKRWVILIAAAALLASCAYATARPRIVAGRDFPNDKMQQVERGMSSNQLRKLLGEPFDIELTENGARWRYYERERQDEKIYILGVLPLRRPYWEVETELIVLFEDDTVRDVSFREQRIR